MQTLSTFYQSIFGCKTYKISLDAACTCPNRDGTKGRGGCIFCSQKGSGDFVSSRNLSITEQVEQGKKLVESKLRGRSGERQGKYIAYFQNFTSTYGDSVKLLSKYHEALSCKDIAGLADVQACALAVDVADEIIAPDRYHVLRERGVFILP